MSSMKNSTRVLFTSLTITAEAIFVVSLGFGIFIYSLIYTTFFATSNGFSPQIYDSDDFIFIVVYEFIALLIIFHILKQRRWTLLDFNLSFNSKMVGTGLLLAGVRIGLGVMITWAIESIHLFELPAIYDLNPSIKANIFSIALLIVVNSIFEEFLLIGYLFKRFEKIQPFFVILISSIVRISFHTYQGLGILPSTLMMGVIFGVYYVQHKRLWPLMIAHAVGNVFYFAMG